MAEQERPTIYKVVRYVEAEKYSGRDGRDTHDKVEVGYAAGDPENIRLYFKNEKQLEVGLEHCEVVWVDVQNAKARTILLNEQADLEKRLDKIKKTLGE